MAPPTRPALRTAVVALGAAWFGATSASVTRSSATPVSKVIELLKRLQTQLEAESTEEAKQYDKYACFCKEEVDEKTYRIEKSQKKIGKLSAEIEALSGDINDLTSGIADLTGSISALKSKIEAAQEARDKDNEGYQKANADISGAIDAMDRAIKALEESKGAAGELEGVKTDLLQLRVVSSRVPHSAAAAAALAELYQAPPSAVYHSNDIISTLQTLRAEFVENKKQADVAEIKARSAFEKTELNLKNSMKFQEKDKREKEQVLGEKTERREALESDKNEENAGMKADQSFRSVLVTECEEKAQLWDQRSKARASELTAIAEAMSKLEEGVKPNYSANKKLTDLQVSSRKAGVVVATPHSFVQLRSASSEVASAQVRVVRAAMSTLTTAARRLDSKVLMSVALRANLVEDHFVKVRQLIKDLLGKLRKDADEEADDKALCDASIAESTSQRDNAQGEIEALLSSQASKVASKEELSSDIAELSEGIASERKALLEANELREKESANNVATLRQAEEGKAAVTMALKVLREFYEGAALLQTGYVPTNSDREGNTVGDKAPEVFDGEYKGAQQASKGILGLLEVILSDFDRTIEKVSEEEKAAVEAFDEFKKDAESSIQEKETSKKAKADEVADLESDLMDLEEDLATQKKLLDSALKSLEVLSSKCIKAEETYAERVARRKEEIEALKQAINVLEDWQG
mmetsp:Transcript_115492/g.333603  ORF Transcript_115492/g.333603 Transcript_115492/m.333603 type:complete len:699 (+) Transcript_115492:81-2177(+)